MTIGTVTQQPLYGCYSCYEECSFTAGHLHVHEGECWCEACWDAYQQETDKQWHELEPFRPVVSLDDDAIEKLALKYIACAYLELRGAGLATANDEYRQTEQFLRVKALVGEALKIATSLQQGGES